MKYSLKELEFIMTRIDKNSHALSEWEQEFFTSVKNRFDAGIPLSDKQKEKISQIWDKMGESVPFQC
jgi:hypothetical protein